jgi:uncharacterized damage-inducible protein DinB
MTLQEVKLLHAYNAWASSRVLDAAGALSVEEYTRAMGTGHGSLHGTLVHMVAAEKRWLSRWVGRPESTLPTTADIPSLHALRTLWESVGLETARFLGTLTDRKLQEKVTATTPEGASFAISIQQSLQHVVDHSSYHRGQAAALIRQLGHTPPQTGMSLFFRGAGPGR